MKKVLVAGALILSLGALFFFVSFFPRGDFSTVSQVDIYLTTNDIHADLILPMRHPLMDWSSFIDLTDYSERGQKAGWVEFGWGDRRFYLEMPTWDQFTMDLAVDALFFPSTAIMHVSAIPFAPNTYTNLYRVSLSFDQYEKIVSYIKNSFALKEGRPQLIPKSGYTDYDNFYDGVGSYSLLNTCNAWTSSALASAGLPRPAFTMAKYGLEWIYRHHRVQN